MLLLAQLVAPPLQPGPVRLPETAPLQENRPKKPDQQRPIFALPEGTPAAPARPAQPPLDGSLSPIPEVRGQSVYSQEQLRQQLSSCRRATPAETLVACAAALTARFTADGYVNTRVFIQATPAPGYLRVVPGRIAELRITSTDTALANDVRSRLRGLQGQVLNLQALERQLVQLRSVPGVGQIKGNLGRLGSDPTEAVLALTIEPAPSPWSGDVSIRNDGNAGTGEWRAVGIVLKNNLATRGDTALVYGELNADRDPELGAVITSLSYSFPLADQLKFTTSFGYSRSNLVEAPGALHNVSYLQYQALGQLEWTLKQDLNQRWMLFAGFSGNSSSSLLGGAPVPVLYGLSGNGIAQTSTGYLRAGLGFGGNSGPVGWGGNLYVLQGIAGVSSPQALASMASVGVYPGQSSALGGVVSVAWGITSRLQFNGRVAGQVSFQPLTNDMGFSLGSDVGLKGLPGTYTSGDNGYLWITELAYTLWRNSRQAVQLVPFIGYGGVSRKRNNAWSSGGVGSGGVLARWLAGANWTFELGWIDAINESDRSYWGNWLLGSGVYTKVQYRF